MKKLILIACLFFSGSVLSAGMYDGIWELTLDDTLIFYVTINQHDNEIIAVALAPDDSHFSGDALKGTLFDNVVNASTLQGETTSLIKVVFDSVYYAVVVQESCTSKNSDYICLLSNNVSYDLNKVW